MIIHYLVAAVSSDLNILKTLKIQSKLDTDNSMKSNGIDNESKSFEIKASESVVETENECPVIAGIE